LLQLQRSPRRLVVEEYFSRNCDAVGQSAIIIGNRIVSIYLRVLLMSGMLRVVPVLMRVPQDLLVLLAEV
jgi:hypothetical protein